MAIQFIGANNPSRPGIVTTNAAVGRNDNQDSSRVAQSGPQPPSFTNSAPGCLFGRQ